MGAAGSRTIPSQKGSARPAQGNVRGAATMPDFVPFGLPDIGEQEISAVVDCLRSGWLTTGPRTQAFEAAFAQYLGGDISAVAVNSCTAGLHLALEAAGVSNG